MDYRLKYIQSLIKKINISETVDFSAMGMNQPSIESPESEKNKREKELSLYERIKKAAPKGWTAKILPPGKGEVDTDSINPDILFIRKKDQKTVKIEAKVLNKSKSKTIQVGCTPTMSHGCAGIPSLRDIESRMREQEKILPNDPFPPRTVRLKTPRKDEAAIEHWRGTASEVFAKNDLHFVESDDDLHIFWPKDEDPPEHIADFLKDSKFQLTHRGMKSVKKSGNIARSPQEKTRGPRYSLRHRLYGDEIAGQIAANNAKILNGMNVASKKN
jgi:hypothetical protein